MKRRNRNRTEQRLIAAVRHRIAGVLRNLMSRPPVVAPTQPEDGAEE